MTGPGAWGLARGPVGRGQASPYEVCLQRGRLHAGPIPLPLPLPGRNVETFRLEASSPSCSDGHHGEEHLILGAQEFSGGWPAMGDLSPSTPAWQARAAVLGGHVSELQAGPWGCLLGGAALSPSPASAWQAPQREAAPLLPPVQGGALGIWGRLRGWCSLEGVICWLPGQWQRLPNSP